MVRCVRCECLPCPREPALAQVKLSPAPLTFGSIAGAPELLETYFNLLYFLLNIIKSY